ncbi:MAG: alpha/beta fold hydrolase [Solirubrobacteraceae bacterium]
MAVQRSAPVSFTPAHRGGDGPPLVCLHGFTDTWRSWELVLPALERRPGVLALTLPGHAGGPPLPDPLTNQALLDALERMLDEAGLATAHIAGNSLGGYLALHLAARGRARSVVALAPAGGWWAEDRSVEDTHEHFVTMQALCRRAVPYADSIVSTPEGRRRATLLTTSNFEHIPPELLAHQLCGVAACAAVEPMVALARQDGWSLDAQRVECPVRIVWGTKDRLLPWPASALRYRLQWLPHADWVVLDGIGHCPQLDVPLEAAELILGVTAS